MVVHHVVVSSVCCRLLVSYYLFFFSDLHMRRLLRHEESLNINGGRDRQKRGLILELSTLKNTDVFKVFKKQTVSQ